MCLPISYLKKLKESIINYEEEIKEALFKDLGKSSQEAYSTEIGIVLSEISLFIHKLKKWTQLKKVKGNLTTFPSKAYIYPEKYGRVLIDHRSGELFRGKGRRSGKQCRCQS